MGGAAESGDGGAATSLGFGITKCVGNSRIASRSSTFNFTRILLHTSKSVSFSPKTNLSERGPTLSCIVNLDLDPGNTVVDDVAEVVDPTGNSGDDEDEEEDADDDICYTCRG